MTSLSEQATTRLRQELDRLRTERDALSPRFGEQDRTGDRVDQADQLERADVAAWLDRRIHEITDLLAGTAPHIAGLLPDGTRVTLRFPDGTREEMTIISVVEGADEEDDSALTSDSPLGLAIVGHSAGDTITYRTPRGELSAEIVELTTPG